MTPYIDKPTAEQEAQLANWVDEWIDLCLRPGPTDPQLFEAAVKNAIASLAYFDTAM